MASKTWKFYVYEVLDNAGDVIYVGKGSNNRMHCSQKTRGGASCHEVARFKRESDAYAFEVKRIAQYSNLLNVHKGGNGSRSKRVRAERPLYAEKNTRKLAAQILMRYWYMVDPSKLEQIRQVAHG
jgi:hypothetical protein